MLDATGVRQPGALSQRAVNSHYTMPGMIKEGCSVVLKRTDGRSLGARVKNIGVEAACVPHASPLQEIGLAVRVGSF